jgi:hypothetical protein
MQKLKRKEKQRAEKDLKNHRDGKPSTPKKNKNVSAHPNKDNDNS